ncbi:Ribonucleotide reductase of class Ia (aerobic),beta subunit [Richelia intracellularis HH01]|uniref:Ribonucleoside-diphosphate reductase subunit beta n=1 Tax=Richelia intracellularis HH01 TaxID=1165094 RepID=M1X093_9NOST|nr:ribonucleotide-diphosphate reductase subunit beta [Richelia intracellularis]CCH67378.1 Ribonucleotide reductase of class Ia (aerobic),beta subunit [Richelia intracellularis HH01]HAE05851.1 ribonucleotide-diphosphate reductase subunit beta [Richelia sp.]
MYQLKQSLMPINPVFNPKGNDDTGNRLIWFGETTNLMQLNDVRYSWAVSLYRQMRENFWIPEKIDITQDIVDYVNLTPEERRAFDGILSYLTFLDSVQTCNVPHLKNSVTAPEIALCMAEQISQEAMHNQSYQYVIETVIPNDRRTQLYEFWRSDIILKERCEFIAGLYQKYVDNPTPENYFVSLLADYLLESIYFYNGFIFFYNLSSRMLMSGIADVFKMINRDELSHVRLYQKLIPEAMKIFPHSREQIYEMFALAVQYECKWTSHIVGDNILGITTKSTEQYTKYLANIRLQAIGLEPLFTESVYKKSPYVHLERLSDTKKEAHTKANFFEASVTSYVMSSSIEGWDDF